MALSAIIFMACESESGDHKGMFENPLSECIIQPSVKIGGEGIIQWNGFDESVSLYLLSENGEEYGLDVEVVTASGLIFHIPLSVPPGVYSLIMSQNGVTDLGKVEVLDMDMPVKGLEVPSSALQGEEILMEGIGFASDCLVILADNGGNEYVLETMLTSVGISVSIPSDLPEAEYEMYLLQDGRSWLLQPSFHVYADVVIKKLKALRLYSPYMGTAEILLEWIIDIEDHAVLTVSEYLVEDDVPELNAYDRYECDENGWFGLVYDGFEASNDLGMSYVFDSDGNVMRAEVLIYGDDETTPFSWTYDSDGNLLDVASPKMSFRSFGYDSGNLVRFRQTEFIYSDPASVNNPYAYDVVWGYMALVEKNDPFIYFPYMLGWYTGSSVSLPSLMRKPSPTGTGMTDCPLSYSFDEDGYVVEMAWRENDDSYRVEYVYE